MLLLHQTTLSSTRAAAEPSRPITSDPSSACPAHMRPRARAPTPTHLWVSVSECVRAYVRACVRARMCTEEGAAERGARQAEREGRRRDGVKGKGESGTVGEGKGASEGESK